MVVKARTNGRIGGIIFAQQLDGHFAVEAGIAGALDHAHAAAADFAEQFVAGRRRNGGRLRRIVVLGRMGIRARGGCVFSANVSQSGQQRIAAVAQLGQCSLATRTIHDVRGDLLEQFFRQLAAAKGGQHGRFGTKLLGHASLLFHEIAKFLAQTAQHAALGDVNGSRTHP